MKYKVFVSSTMSEFERERKDIVNAIKMDQTLDSFFDVYTFENTPSSGQSADYTWQKNVLESDIYIGLIGAEYGTILNSGFSPTETEYDLFHKNSNNVFIFIKDLEKREEKTEKFISKIRDNHTYKLFNNSKSLISEIKRSLRGCPIFN